MKKKRFNNEIGSVMVLVTVALIVLVGFGALAVDGGSLYLTKSKLQNTVDAAALAGAQDLPQDTSTAISTAISYANNNKPSGTTIDTPEIMDGSRAIKVTAHKNVSLGLAKIFGSSLGEVSATATARVDPFSKGSGVLPFGVTENVFRDEDGNIETGDVEIKFGSHGDPEEYWEELANGHSWRGPLRLETKDGGTNGANRYYDNIVNGCGEILWIGKVVPIEPGNMSGKTRTGVNDFLDEYDPPYGLIPIVEPIYLEEDDPQYGNAEIDQHNLRIAEFAIFEILGVAGNGNQSIVTGRFVTSVVAGIGEPINEDGDDDGGEYSAYVARLVE